MASNHKLRLNEYGESISRRLRLVPCNQILTAETKDTHIVEKVLTEAPAILYALMQEAVKFYADDKEPKCGAIERENAAYIESQDTIGTFLTETFETAERVKRSELFKNYDEWCKENNYKPFAKNRFFVEVSMRGYQERKIGEVYIMKK
jgi:phage/plasmid-associated DNA primase